MRGLGFTALAGGACAIFALAGCASAPPADALVELEVAGPPVDPPAIPFPNFYRPPQPAGDGPDGGRLAQGWSMLGREDRSAAHDSGGEYRPRACEAVAGSPEGWDAVIDAIAARAARHRVVIINESHMVTRHRETTRRLLAKLRPLGFTVLAAETFMHGGGGPAPVEAVPAVTWPRMIEGTYAREAAFGRLVREAKAQGYRLAPYEEIYDSPASVPQDRFASIIGRETAQARHLAEIVRQMDSNEKLIVHAGYGHGSEVAIDSGGGRDIEWMGARFKALTGIDPLTVTQTACRSAGGSAFLAAPPASMRPGQFDMVVSHPTDTFTAGRANWRREAGDVAVPVPEALRPNNAPLIIEAFAWGEPFDAVPVDRVYLEPGEDLPLMLPPGRYRVRGVRLAAP